MYKIIMFAGITACLFACNSANDKQSDETKKEDNSSSSWVSLFDGTTMNGWHPYGGGKNVWKVADSMLCVDTSIKGGGPDLITDDEYENFDLKLEWRIAPNGNSGIIFYVHEDTAKYKNTYETGPEMQVLDNEGHEDGKIPKHHAGDLYDLIACSKETVKPVGQWNDVEIKCMNGKLDFFLNGENVVSTTMWDDNWNTMVAGSKFKSMPGFGTFKKGHIALQYHGYEVCFRNIRIMKL